MRSTTFFLAALLAASAVQGRDYLIRPVPFTDVKVSDQFWRPRMDTNRKVTVWYCFKKCEATGRIDNFAKAARLMPGEFRGTYYDDSDVYKVIEGAAYALAIEPDPKLDKYLDDLIAKIAGAQEPDGYLYTPRTINPAKPPEQSGPTRWSNEIESHETYCAGHMYEAAVAHYQVTGKKTLLDVAIKNADLMVKTFGPDGLHEIPGHEEIEIGLVKLFRITGNEQYLKLAKFFIDGRGHPEGRKTRGAEAQDHKPVIEQDEPVGHAVRAGYLYSGMADVAAIMGYQPYVQALDKIWNNLVSTKLYLTGGIGVTGGAEAFGQPYELPNAQSYAETCAAIANALWNHRMFLLHGDSKYIDVLERVIYNGFLSGVSLEGDRFFYVNPLASNGEHKFNHGSATRSPWFGCACCPVNVVRFMPSIAGYVYASRPRRVYINLYVAGGGQVKLRDGTVRLTQETRYPWDGRVRITVKPEKPAEFDIFVRVPGWAATGPVPSDLYRFAGGETPALGLTVNGQPARLITDSGYVALRREWKDGDIIELNLPMPVRRVVAHPKLEADAGRVALERGPIVYCLEGVDNNGRVKDIVLPKDAELKTELRPGLLGGVTAITGKAERRLPASLPGEAFRTKSIAFTAIPYFAWNHRGAGEMAVWVPER